MLSSNIIFKNFKIKNFNLNQKKKISKILKNLLSEKNEILGSRTRYVEGASAPLIPTICSTSSRWQMNRSRDYGNAGILYQSPWPILRPGTCTPESASAQRRRWKSSCFPRRRRMRLMRQTLAPSNYEKLSPPIATVRLLPQHTGLAQRVEAFAQVTGKDRSCKKTLQHLP